MSPSVIELAKKRARSQVRGYLVPDVFDAGLDDDDVPPRQWLLGNTFCRTFLSMAIGRGGAGKSALRLTQLIAAALGRGDLVGEHVFQRCHVLLVSFEDDRPELRRRIKAACKHHGIDRRELIGWLHYWTPFGFRLAERDQAGDWTEGSLYGELKERVRLHEIDIVSIDPFARSHAGVENDNAEMDFVASLLVKFAIECNVAVDVTHHTRKGEAEAGDADAARGAIAVINAARLAYTITTMTVAEASNLGVEDDKRKAFIRLDNAKVNLAPPSATARWFKLVGVPLENATPLYPEGDNVQAVEPWSPPEVVDELTRDRARKILEAIDRGYPGKNSDIQRYSGSNNSKPPAAAWALVQEYMPTTKQRAQKVIDDWLKQGMLKVDTYWDKERREDRPGLFVLRRLDDIYNPE